MFTIPLAVRRESSLTVESLPQTHSRRPKHGRSAVALEPKSMRVASALKADGMGPQS
jgi:hypothetical protein